MSLQDKVVVIMGASSGIGAATARLLAERGAKLTLAARRLARLEEIKSAYPEASIETVEADVTDMAAVQAVIDHTVAKFGRVDVLFNNAGSMPVNNLSELAHQEWQQKCSISMLRAFLTESRPLYQ